ncbi:2-phospho-L-lactate transferase [Microvirga sp. SRT01]|uniref:2-phospho-L-lactate transferase n=1 Tax=Sphingomonas longa TaxID=2778730 RepID=A0ABS2DA78_9SPHN|nr:MULTISPECIES: 2-phospho-L-lactate transferase [Alphaproteobacteria]MBM6577835.1 2-phospho-L-lactate transferase [Sphingomonas sp. BT552]MBR7710877.1 2-phospho-L-lactate transferase [Microvirga sp. SRT01]
MKVVVLTGGVGGAKLVLGLQHALPPGDLTAVVNVGDDFTHLGLRVCPDLDTLLYTLAGKSNTEQGWGRAGEGWRFMEELRSLGAPDWFNLGDRDLAIHVLRTAALAQGEPLSAVMDRLRTAWAVPTRILPASDQHLATMLDTDEGRLAFQTYFVARRCEPQVERVVLEGVDAAQMAPGVGEAIAAADGVILAPSNPYLSVDPILAIPGMAETLRGAHVVAVTPVLPGRSFKGPTARMMTDFGHAVDSGTVARHYAEVANILVVDPDETVAGSPIRIAHAPVTMNSLDEKVALAEACLRLLQ